MPVQLKAVDVWHSYVQHQKIIRISAGEACQACLRYSSDVTLYPPIRPKTAIENFLKVSIMASEGLKKIIRFENNKADSITAQVIFERGEQIKGKFVFHFVIESYPATLDARK